MRQHQLYSFSRLTVVDVAGDDAAAIVHNVTTNGISGLEPEQGNETFITDVRGKMLGHVVAYSVDGVIRLLGAEGQSQRIVEHLDRYTIREDATPTIRDEEFAALVVAPELAATLGNASSTDGPLQRLCLSIGGVSVDMYACPWLGKGSGVLPVPVGQVDDLVSRLQLDHDVTCGNEEEFHQARTHADFPWYGVDLTDSNLPQEADRDSLAISFTKGCYLGQETVARLDALGQVQKKLVMWSIPDGIPAAGTAVLAGDKTVGRLTSVAANGKGGAIAIGPARRSHFETGSTGACEALDLTASVL